MLLFDLALLAQACVASIAAKEDALSILLVGCRHGKVMRPSELREIFALVYGKVAIREANFIADKMRVMIAHLKRTVVRIVTVSTREVFMSSHFRRGIRVHCSLGVIHSLRQDEQCGKI